MMLGIAGEKLTPKENLQSSVTKIGGNPTFSQTVLLASASSTSAATTSASSPPSFFKKLTDLCTCKRCKKPLFLISQVFCPFRTAPREEEGEKEQNRMIYVCACNSSECTRAAPSESFCAVSVQIDEEEEDDENDEEEEEEEETTQQETQEEQEDEKNKKKRKKKKLEQPPWPVCFPEPLVVDIEEEPEVDNNDDEKEGSNNNNSNNNKKKKKSSGGIPKTKEEKEQEEKEFLEREKKLAAELNDKIAQETGAGSNVKDEELQELETTIDLKDKRVDEMHSFFTKTLSKAPRQVLRYNSDGKQSPIFQDPNKVQKVQLNACERCGAGVGFELQVLPTAIYFLACSESVAAERRNKDDGLDFGTITVYSCSKECARKAKGLQIVPLQLVVEPAPTLTEEAAAAKKEGRKTFRDIAGVDEKN